MSKCFEILVDGKQVRVPKGTTFRDLRARFRNKRILVNGQAAVKNGQITEKDRIVIGQTDKFYEEILKEAANEGVKELARKVCE